MKVAADNFVSQKQRKLVSGFELKFRKCSKQTKNYDFKVDLKFQN